MNSTTTPTARARLERLRGESELLAARLEQAAEALQRIGAPPDASLPRDLRALDEKLKSLLADCPRLPHSESNNLWDALDASIRRQEQRTIVAPQLRLVARLRHRSQDLYEPLDAAQLAAAEWLTQLESDHPLDPDLLESLLLGQHGLPALARLATNAGDLSDSDWVADQNLVADAYGRTLALAAARGQLHLSAEVISPPPLPASTETPRFEFPPDRGTASRELAVAKSVGQSTAATAPTPAVDRTLTPVQKSSSDLSPTSFGGYPAAPAVAGSLREGVTLAQRTRESNGTARRRELNELIWTLVAADRLGLAWQLNRCAESLYGSRIAPGTEILQIAALGAHLRDAGGSIAQLLTRLLSDAACDGQRFDPRHLTAPQRLLLQAGLLNAAWFAPATGAADWFRRYAACAAAGESLLRLTELLERRASDRTGLTLAEDRAGATHRRNYHRLQQQVRDWQTAWSSRAVEFRKAEPLFARQHWSVRTTGLPRTSDASPLVSGWLATLRLADSLIAPILANADEAKADVRRIVGRVNSRLLVGDRADFPAGADAIIVPHDDMRRYLQEASQWAQRWLQGDGAMLTMESPDVASPDVATSALQEEVQRLVARTTAAAPPATGTAECAAQQCWLQALARFNHRLTSTASTPELEPAVNQLFGEDVRRLHLATLGPQAIPIGPEAEFLDRLLQALTIQENWTLLATRDIEFCKSQPADTGNSVLEHFAARPATFEEELNAMAESLDHAAEAGVLNDREHAGLSARLCALWSDKSSLSADREAAFRDLQRRLADRGVVRGGQGRRPSTTSVIASPAADASFLLDDELL